MSNLSHNLEQVERRIQNAQREFKQCEPVTLLAVSKTQPADAVRTLFNLGQHDFAENYLQEALSKQQQLDDLAITWHFIGPIQSNKTKAIAEQFSWVHSVDRLKIAERLSAQRAGLPPLNICLQINLNQETSKSGCAVSALDELVDAVIRLPNLVLRGLMVIPQATQNHAQQRANFAKVALLLQQQNQRLAVLNQAFKPLDVLSMGMSDDLEAAVAEGATHVRIGTALFGPR